MLNSERLAILLVLVGAGSRLLHLPPNIAAVTGGVSLARRTLHPRCTRPSETTRDSWRRCSVATASNRRPGGR